MHVRPLQDWLTVKLDPLPETTQSGLFLSASAQERQRSGTVLRIGPGRPSTTARRKPMEVSPGDRIVFFRENLEHSQGKAMTRLMHELEENTGMIRMVDILYVIEGE